MTTAEQMWFVIGIGGFVLLLENAIIYILKKFWKRADENLVKVIVGAVIYVLAIVMLFNLPRQ